MMKTLLSFALLLFVTASSARGQEQPLIEPAAPLSAALAPDGTLKKGVQGSFRSEGYQVSQNSNGEPVFHSDNSTPAPFSWATLGEVSYSAGVFCIAISGTNVFVGGVFQNLAGNPNADNIARWDGNTWHALGSGLNENVRAMAVSGNDVYVGGFFTDAGGNPNADIIARWDGNNWNAMGTGIGVSVFNNHYVNSIVVSGNMVYVGGSFPNAGGTPNANHLARWDGSSWHVVIPGLNGEVTALALSGSDLYLTGRFTNVNGNPNTNGIARWDGTTIHALGTGLDLNLGTQYLNTIAVSGSTVFVGGTFPFSTRGTPSINLGSVARWDGNSWSSLGAPVSFWGIVILSVGSDLYVGQNRIDPTGHFLSRWTGSAWDSAYFKVGRTNDFLGLDGPVNAIAAFGSDLFVGGSFRVPAMPPAMSTGRRGITRWIGAYPNPPVASVTNSVAAGGGLVSFNTTTQQTSVRIQIAAGGGNGTVSVQRANGAPVSPTGIAGNVSQYRWTIQQNGFAPSFTGTVRFRLSEFGGGGIANPNTVVAYSRPTPGVGAFTARPTTFDPATGDLVVTVSSFSEFAFGSSTNPLSADINKSASPQTFKLEQNYPNPFNPTTVIAYQLPTSSDVRLEVFDMLGRSVSTLVRATQSAGTYRVPFDAQSAALASGMYFYRLDARSASGNFTQTGKMILSK
jgi:hypothetical protein